MSRDKERVAAHVRRFGEEGESICHPKRIIVHQKTDPTIPASSVGESVGGQA